MSVSDDPNCAFFKAMDIGDKVQGRTKLKMDGDFKDVIVERVENCHRVTLIPFAGASESEFKHLIGGKVYADDHVENLGDMGGMYYDIGSSPKAVKATLVSCSKCSLIGLISYLVARCIIRYPRRRY